MNFAKKLKEVVTSNFIEIARTDEERAGTKSVPEIDRAVAPDYMEARPAPPSPSLESPALVDEVTPKISDVPAVPEAPLVVPKLKEDHRPLLEKVAPSEPIDLERVLQDANLPEVAFNAEQASKVLSALPYDLPMQVKRLTVKATLEAVERGRTIQAQDIVADAMLKKAYIAQYQEAFSHQAEGLQSELDQQIIEVRARIETEIARLKAEAERIEGLKQAVERKQKSLNQVAMERVNQMEQVIVFFQSEVANNLEAERLAKQQEDEEEIPPFMRDDAVLRLLGMEKEAASAEAETGEASDASQGENSPDTESSGAARRERTTRRRIAMTEVEA